MTKNISTEAAIVFGCCEANGGNPFNGALDEIRLYNQALSASEVAYLAGYALPFSIDQDLDQDGTIDLKDYALLTDSWLEELLWPHL